MAAKWIEMVTGPLEDKKRWRRYKARKKALPTSYRTAIEGLERYFMYARPITDGGVYLQMCDDLADLIERAAADGTPIREVVGDDPVEFADTFIQNYADGQWINKERQRLNDAIGQSTEEA